MSIANELNRLLQAKSDLATSIAAKGVTVPAATTIDGYAALVDQIQQGGGTLPYDAEVEYLQSSGIQYINTGVQVNNTFTFYSKVAALDATASTTYWGARNSGSYNSRGQQCYLNNNPATQQTSTIHLWTDSTSTEYQENSWNSGITPAVNTMYELSAMTCYSGLGQLTRPLYLFASNNLGTPVYATCRIGLWVAYSGCTKVAEMIPVRVGQVGYMYDKVSGNLFGNSGTGSFTLGPDIT
jgi:hypothetical protein